MAETQAGSAVIDIKAQDNTQTAFLSVSENISNFGKQLKVLEGNFKPIQELMKGGLAVGGITTGLSLLVDSGIGEKINSITASLSGLKDTASETSGVFSKLMGIFNGNTLAKIAGMFTAAATAGYGMVTTLKQMAKSWVAVNAIVTALKLEFVKTAASMGLATGSMTLFQKASVLATASVNSLSTALGINPFTAWIVAITALVAVIYSITMAIVKYFGDQKTAAQEATEQAKAMQEQHEKTRESCQGYIDRLEQLNQMEKQGKDVSEEKQQVLDELRKKFEGTGYTVDDLTGKVIDANGNLVDMRTALADIADNDISNTIRAISGEIDELNSKLQDGDISWGRWIGTWVTFGYMDNADEIKAKIEEKKRELEEQKQKQTQNRIERDKPKIDEENKRIEEEKKQAEKRQAFEEKGLKLQADMEKTIRLETMSALEKELEAVSDITKARREELELARKKGEITKESYDKEIAAMDNLEQKRKDQIKAKYKKEADSFYTSFEEKIKKEKQDKAEKEEEKSLNQAIETNPFEALKTIQGKITTANSAYDNADRQWQEAVKAANSDGVITKEEKEQIAKLEQVRAEAKARVEKMQGLRDSAQGKANERVEKAYNQALEKARKSREVNPVDTLMKGSVEAYKKELENANRGRTVDPTVVKLDELKKQMAAEAKEKADREKRTSDYVKKICESVGAV